MMNKTVVPILALLCLFSAFNSSIGQEKSGIGIQGKHFEYDGRPFEFTGISFFNAIYNQAFNRSSDARCGYLKKFSETGINVLRIWCQWDNARGFADGGKGRTLYTAEGSLNPDYLKTLKEILTDADRENMVIELVLFSRESWNENLRLSDSASNQAVRRVSTELKPWRNLVFQIWNEFDYRTVDYLKIIKSVDPARIVTNSPGYSGFLGSPEENRALDYLSPHTTRDDDRHWEMAPMEIAYLLGKYKKPVVDDEPARRGTPSFGGPKTPVNPNDHILQIYSVWKAGGYINYHHDMFQTGYNSGAVPPDGIPLPGFSDYHDQVFRFLKEKERYLKQIR